MKKIVSYSILFAAVISLFSCGPKRPSAEQVDNFMESLSLRMSMTKDNYMRFVNTLPEKHDMMSGTMVKSIHEFIIKGMKEERALIDKCKTLEADESAKTKSETLKQAGIEVIDTYIDGANNELNAVKDLISQGKTNQSPEVKALLNKFETRLNTKYETYSNIQVDLAKDFGIIIY